MSLRVRIVPFNISYQLHFPKLLLLLALETLDGEDEYETCLGKLSFRDGLPDDDTVQKVYDNLDRQGLFRSALEPSRPTQNPEQLRAKTQSSPRLGQPVLFCVKQTPSE